MSMRNYIVDPDYDCPDPTPAEQLHTEGKRSLLGLLLVEVLTIIGIVCVLAGSAKAQTLTAPTRISPYDWACLDASGAVLSNHQRFDTAFVACHNNAAGAEIVGGRYRISRPTAPPEPPEPCPAQPADQTRAGVCPTGTTGSWVQTLTYTAAPQPACWTPGEWLPSSPPAGACTTPPPATLPAPTAISATVSPNATNPGNHNVALSWLSVAGASGYALERCTGSTCTNFAALGTTTNTAYTNANVPGGLTYRYRVQGTPNGAWSTPRNVTTPTATTPPPTGTGTALLQWIPPTENTDGSLLSNLAGYRIVYGTAPGSLTRTIQIANAAASAYTVESLAAGTWYFAVTAYNSRGYESDPSNVVTKVVP